MSEPDPPATDADARETPETPVILSAPSTKPPPSTTTPDGQTVEITGKHVVAAVAVHLALIAATVILLGWSIPGIIGIVVLFLIFPKLTEAVARAWR